MNNQEIEVTPGVGKLTCMYCNDVIDVKSNNWWYKKNETCICKKQSCISEMQDSIKELHDAQNFIKNTSCSFMYSKI